jgi:DNA gyrase subunit A
MNNYDNTLKEPCYLPVKTINYLLNSNSGIAVGFRCFIPSFNLKEISDTVIRYIKNNKNISIDELMELIPGPDFPVGGEVGGKTEIKKLYEEGISNILIRGTIDIDEEGNSVYIKELPYSMTLDVVLDNIKKGIKEDLDKKKESMIADIIDESSDKENRIKVRVKAKKGVDLSLLRNQLFKRFGLEKSMYTNFYGIQDGNLKLFNMKEIIGLFVDFRRDTIIRITKFEIEGLLKRKEILEGLIKVSPNIKEIIKIIKSSKNTEEAKTNLMKGFSFTELQAEKILELKLSKLTKLENNKLHEELLQIKETLKVKEKLISKEKYVLEQIVQEQEEMKKFNIPRRTKIIKTSNKTTDEELISNDKYLLQVSQQDLIRKCKIETNIKVQKRAGKGRKNVTEKEGNIKLVKQVNNLDSICFFTEKGKVFVRKVYQIPENEGIGKHISNYIPIQNDKINNIMVLSEEDMKKSIVFLTKKGNLKKIKVNTITRANNLIIMKIKKDDALKFASLTSSNDKEIFISGSNGRFNLFSKKLVPTLKRTAMGVKTLKLDKDDEITSMHLIDKNTSDNFSIFSITKNGTGKKTAIKELSRKKTRRVKGMQVMKLKKGDKLITTTIVQDSDKIFIYSKAKNIYIECKQIPQRKKNTFGNRLMRLDKEDEILGVEKILY